MPVATTVLPTLAYGLALQVWLLLLFSHSTLADSALRRVRLSQPRAASWVTKNQHRAVFESTYQPLSTSEVDNTVFQRASMVL